MKTIKILLFIFLPICSLAQNCKNNFDNKIYIIALEEYIKHSPIEYWIYGHSHRNIDKIIGKTKCVTNQLGYVSHNEHLSFDLEKIIEL